MLELEEMLIRRRNESQMQFNDCVLKVWTMRQKLIADQRNRKEREQASRLTDAEIAALVGVKKDE